ncbi:MAG TPA: hypothetical protein VKI17_12060, partial [Gemmataceae bacterium]|nr:hypothetical protein [Gemmataceae bacterium]
MSNPSLTHLEPERYEFFAGPAYTFDLDRRDFFKIAGGGLVVLCLMEEAAAQEPGRGRGRGFGGNMAPEIGA